VRFPLGPQIKDTLNKYLLLLTKRNIFDSLSSPLNFFGRTKPEEKLMGQTVDQAMKEVVEASIHQNRAILVIFKARVGEAVITALDSIVEMEMSDRIHVRDDDIEKMRFARFEGRWKSSKDDRDTTQLISRSIELWPGKNFKLSVFMLKVAPGLAEVRPSVHFS
jgi:hypothetical protein